MIGTVVGLLNIRMVGEASKTGTLELLQKARGQKKAIKAAFDELIKAGYTGGLSPSLTATMKKIYRAILTIGSWKILPMQWSKSFHFGLCSFYAEEGGLLMGYEI